MQEGQKKIKKGKLLKIVKKLRKKTQKIAKNMESKLDRLLLVYSAMAI